MITMAPKRASAIAAAQLFALLGNVGSGMGVVCSVLMRRDDVGCHRDIFHPDKGVRRRAHEAYFGPGGPASECHHAWLDACEPSPYRYVRSNVFRNRVRCEQAVGVCLTYALCEGWDLGELFNDCDRAGGGFRIIHVWRNPVACYISAQQRLATLTDRLRRPLSLHLAADDLTVFCRAHTTSVTRVRALRPRQLEVPYAELVTSYQTVMERVMTFLGLSDPSRVPAAAARPRNRTIRDRISNFDQLLKEVPSDVRGLMLSTDLY